MACTPLTGIAKGCDGNLGGIRSAYIFDMDDINTFTENTTTWQVTALTLVNGASAEDYYFRKEVSNYVETEAQDTQNGSGFVTATITLMFHRREAAKSRALKILAEGQRYLGVVVGDNNGKFWYFPEVQLTENTEGSGTAYGDGTKYAVTLVGKYPYLAKEIDAAIAAALLIPAS